MLKKIYDFSELVAFKHTIFSASFMLIALICASIDYRDSMWIGFEKLIFCALALMFARNFAMAFNRLCDRDIDSKNLRTIGRPSVDGRIGYFSLLLFCALNAVLFIFVSYLINSLAFYLSFPFLVVLGGYSYMKRFSSLAHLVLGIALGLAPISGAIAILGSVPLWSVLLSIGVMFWVAGFDLLYSLQDIEFDKKQNLYSIPSRFGIKATLAISKIFHILTIVFWFGFLYVFGAGIFAYIGLLVCFFMLVYEHYIVRISFENIPKAFFITNGYLGFVFLIFMIIDGVFR